jgi:methyl-accepting chemotaxis protein
MKIMGKEKEKTTTKSIKTKLVLVFTAIILFLNIFLSFLSITIVRQNLIESTHSGLIEIAKEEAKYIQSIRDAELKYIDALAQNPVITSASVPMDQKAVFCQAEAKRAGYYQFLLADPSGNTIDLSTGTQGASVANQDFFKKAMNGKASASDVMVTDNKDIIIAFAAPVMQNGQPVSVLIGKKDGHILSDLVSKVQYKKTGFAYMVNDNGTAIGYRNIELVVNRVNYIEAAKEDAKLKELSVLMKEKILKREAGSGDYSYEGNAQIVAFAPVEGSPWIIAVGVITKEVLGEVNALRNILIVLCLASVAFGTVIVNIASGKITKPIRKLALAADKLALGDVEVNVADVAKSKDEIGALADAFDKMIGNIKGQADAARKIAAGDLSFELEPRSEKDVLGISLVSVIDNLKRLIGETEQMVSAALGGILENRGKAGEFEGAYQDIVEGFNKTMDAVIGPLNMSASYMEHIGKGDIPEKITDEYQGDFDTIKENLNACIDAVGMLVADTKMLSDAAIAGDLMKRADAKKHQGDFRKVVEGVNGTLDTVVDKAAWYEAIIDAIPFPVHVTDMDMKWIYLNKAFEKVMIDQGVIEDREACYGMDCHNANADICRTEGCGIRRLIDQGIGETFFEWAGMSNKQNTAYLKNRKGENVGFVEVVTDLTQLMRVSGYTESEVRRLEENLKLLACGSLDFDLNITETDEYTAEVSQQFSAIGENLAGVKQAVGALIADAAGMTEAAVGGDLKNRADVTKHGGEFAKIMEGFNKTLDAVIAPINEASAVLQEMAKGNLQVTMEGDYQGDHAAIKNALNETLSNLRSYVSELTAVLSEISNGNLNLAITADYKGDFVEIKNSLNDITASLGQVMGDISEAADQVASGSRQVSDGSQALSQGSTEQASSIQELTASIAEIASQTKQNAVNANQASQLAGTARDNAERGNSQMKDMLNSMEEINESSANISKIIRVIDDIAFQTNILALNAAVEAARAGQHGKGFAVVAEEVRNLAARSATAARETTELIEGSIRKAQAGTRIANETASALEEIVTGIEKSAGLVVNIAEASNEQASGIAQINKGIEQVSMVTQNNSATAEESAAASEELSSQAELLKEMVGRFKVSKDVKGLPGADMRLLGSTGESQTKQKKTAAEPRILLGNDNLDKY